MYSNSGGVTLLQNAVCRFRSECKEGAVGISCKQSMSVPCCWCRSIMASRLSMFLAVL